MIRIVDGNCYVFGPHVDGFYSVECVQRVLEDGTIIAHFRNNAHQQLHISEEVVAEVGCDCIGGKHGRDWFEPNEIGQGNLDDAIAKGHILFQMRYERWHKHS